MTDDRPTEPPTEPHDERPDEGPTDVPDGPPTEAPVGTARRRRRTLAGAAVALGVVVAAVAGVVAFREPPARPGGLVILYGDSLAMEASAAFADELAATSDAEVVNRALPGLSPCDALPTMEDDVALDPTVVVLQFVGNNSTACSLGPGGERLAGQALVDRTRADVEAAAALFAGRGTRVVLVGGPDAPGLPDGGAALAIADAYNRIVDQWGGADLGMVRYADAAATVSGPDHAFASTLPCRGDEGEAEGCVDGEVVVRSPDRIHFCPVEHDGLGCPVPAPGADRFGREMARVARLALDPEY
jgi:hypothetical protein